MPPPALLAGALSRSFFFFQAEDGIRDWSVTGVQTCALPISLVQPIVLSIDSTMGWTNGLAANGPYAMKATMPPTASRVRKPTVASKPTMNRSEERRVGKEGRAGGGTESYKRRGRE